MNSRHWHVSVAVSEMRQRVQHRQIEKETRQSVRLAMGHLNPTHNFAQDILFDSEVGGNFVTSLHRSIFFCWWALFGNRAAE